jgi:hypothetical protein
LKKFPVFALPVLLLCTATSFACASESAAVQSKNIKSWTDLKPSPIFKEQGGIAFYQFKTDNGSDVNLIVLDLNAKDLTVKPFFNRIKATTSEAATRLHALTAVNGGYFNLSNGESTSYVVIDQNEQCDPKTNKALMGNPKLASFLPEILRRSEIRFFRGANGTRKATIAFHDAPVPKGWTLEHSLQAGPRLLPESTIKEEAFVRTGPDGKVIDSIGSQRTAARTAFGITPDNHALLVCVAGKGQNEFSAGISLPELANLLQHLGCRDAINCDGGTSTTMVVNQDLITPDAAPASQSSYRKICGGTPEKLVKSGLAVVGNP